MPSLFPRWTNSLARLSLFALALGAIGVPIFLMVYVRTPYVTDQSLPYAQPIPFDHRHHVVDDGIDCRYCHNTVERSPSAGIPATGLCMNCHNQIWNSSPLLGALWESFETRRPIAWRRVYQLPDFVFFNHAIHVNKGVGCETCHGRVDRMARVYQVPPLTMKWCLDCHWHPERYLRPREAITVMGWTPPRPQSEIGERLVAEYAVKRLTDCYTCHR